MRNLILLIIFLLKCSGITGQIGFVGMEKLPNKAVVVGGEDFMYNLLLEELRFPDAYLNIPVVSIVLACIEIDARGNVVRFFSLNDSDPYFVSEINRVISRNELKWSVPCGDTSYFIIPIEFRNVVEEKYKTDYYFMPGYIHKPVTCFSTLPVEDFVPDSIHVNSFESYLKQNKYGKAMKELNILINRQPFKEIFYIKKIRLYTYSGKLEEARIEKVKLENLFRNESVRSIKKK
jgi:hypothetical protein